MGARRSCGQSGIFASLLDYLSKLNEADFGELIQYADFFW